MFTAQVASPWAPTATACYPQLGRWRSAAGARRTLARSSPPRRASHCALQLHARPRAVAAVGETATATAAARARLSRSLTAPRGLSSHGRSSSRARAATRARARCSSTRRRGSAALLALGAWALTPGPSWMSSLMRSVGSMGAATRWKVGRRGRWWWSRSPASCCCRRIPCRARAWARCAQAARAQTGGGERLVVCSARVLRSSEERPIMVMLRRSMVLLRKAMAALPPLALTTEPPPRPRARSTRACGPRGQGQS
mmetsp:Transcript_1257/g.5014  ORF Transcript_1257/g.5014 Transcript_1257/m.5014 type:complete len:256 (-) Transcript_1257:1339-2106(-)